MNDNMAKTVANIKYRTIPNDKIYTPPQVAIKMIEMCDIKPDDIVLDPCRGGSVFFDNFPECHKEYCEIDEDIDFLKYEGNPTVICGNPPFSLYNQWILKTIELKPEKICYLFGIWNMMPNRFSVLEQNGYYIEKIFFCKIDWYIGATFAVLLSKNKNDNISFFSERVICDKCNKLSCRRGKDKDINKCRFL